MQPERSPLNFGPRYQQNSFTYDVKRDVYNEESFQQEHRRKSSSSGNLDVNVTTIRHHVQCRCSWHRFLGCMLMIFPFLEWVCLYRIKDWLLGDLLAGISVGLVQVPQALMFSLLGRQLIPPLNIAYAAFCSSVFYVIFGSCHQMSLGFFFLVSALMINVLKVNPFNSGHLVLGTFIKEDFTNPEFIMDYSRSLNVVASTTFLAGIIQLCMGMLGFGFIATYLPDAFISAYLAATALHIMISQLTCVFGIMIGFHSGPISFFYNIISYCAALPKANSTSILLFLTVLVALRINKCIKISFNRYPIEFPMEFLLIVGFTLISNKLSMVTETSRMLTEMIPYSFQFPVIPDMNILGKVILQAISLALVSSALLIFLGKKISTMHNYNVNSNQDLLVTGVCNLISSLFRCTVFTADIARTVIQDKSGGRQQFASLIGAGLMLLLMVKMASIFNQLPNAVMAGIILSNVLTYLETIAHLPDLWSQDQYDCVIWLATLLSVLFLGLDAGLLVSVAFSFFIITIRSHRANFLILGQIPNTNIYRSISDYREITSIPGVKIVQCCNSITFVNVYYLKKKLLKETEMNVVHLTEEEILNQFGDSAENESSEPVDRGCRCFCNCDEPEPPPRVVYTERYEYKPGSYSSSSINLVRCSRFENVTVSQTSTSDEEIPYTLSSPYQRNQGQNLEEMDKTSMLNTHLRNNTPPLPGTAESQGRNRSYLPYSDVSLLPPIHTIILDFSMVHYVDPRASVILRQNEDSIYQTNNGSQDISQPSPGFRNLILGPRKEIRDNSELDLEMEPMLDSEQENLNRDLESLLEPDSEIDLDSELERKSEMDMLETDADIEPEPQPGPKPRKNTFNLSPKTQRPQYQTLYQGSSQSQPQTGSERRYHYRNLPLSKGNNVEDPWEENWV
ncbi:PREDICTED: testis anion transporter 1 [Elephantulus edwardii]|uniref:testis anion transporter 1 n=1 Tax=Elephantulus edwardii TaxID=28737 RepID=UPI0003F085EA|nr:PREDICTED: testis anion transporter 1 [Elephantulus edwardii]